MIARKIVYKGQLDAVATERIYEIARRKEITGEVKFVTPNQVELDLEGDPAVIKLLQHQIERGVKGLIQDKSVTPNPFRYYDNFTLFL